MGGGEISSSQNKLCNLLNNSAGLRDSSKTRHPCHVFSLGGWVCWLFPPTFPPPSPLPPPSPPPPPPHAPIPSRSPARCPFSPLFRLGGFPISKIYRNKGSGTQKLQPLKSGGPGQVPLGFGRPPTFPIPSPTPNPTPTHPIPHPTPAGGGPGAGRSGRQGGPGAPGGPGGRGGGGGAAGLGGGGWRACGGGLSKAFGGGGNETNTSVL